MRFPGEDSQQAGAGSQRLAEDNEELAMGDADVSAGKYESGIEHYRNAWMHALHLKITGFGHSPSGTVFLKFVTVPQDWCGVLASTNLMDWTMIEQCTAPADGVIEFKDVNATSFTSRFYRAIRLP